MKPKEDQVVRNPRASAPVIVMDLRRPDYVLDREIRGLPGDPSVTWEIDSLDPGGTTGSGWVYRGSNVIGKLVHSPAHTPGPWKLIATGERDRKTQKLRDIALCIEPATYPRPEREFWKDQGGPPAFTICRVPVDSGCQGDAEANARLLAAAPDLLDALVVLKRAASNRPAALRDTLDAACQQAQRAIEKALTGKETE